MIIKKIKLENIRSYLNQEIEFPEGSVLLSGDIGSGKSSVLLAVEFALFGFVRGEIEGGALLRKGADKGSVELNFQVGSNDVLIKRGLKKTSSGVSQDAGYIIVNGSKNDLTAMELKQKILELLNYPQELLTKKSLIYRYTVYTPQEEMKNILLGDKGYRLDTLRRVFNIDKYKRIRENAKIIISNLREKIREYETRIIDLEDKQKELNLKEEDLIKNKKSFNEIVRELNISKEILKEKKGKVKVYEEEINKIKELKQKLEIVDVNFKNKSEKLRENKLKINEFIKEVKEELPDFSENEIKTNLENKDNLLKEFESNLKSINKKINEFSYGREHSFKVKDVISDLSKCPTCMQEVSDEYKKQVFEREDKKIKELDEEIKLYCSKEKEIDDAIDKLKRDIDKLRGDERKIEIIKFKKEQIKLKEEIVKRLGEENLLIEKELSAFNSKKEGLLSLIKENKIDEEGLRILREEIDEFLEKERSLDIKKATLENEIKNIEDLVGNLKEEIEEKIIFKNKLKKIRVLKENIENKFIGLMEVIERSVMMKVHGDFDSLFRKWFEMLVDSEVIKVKLDSEFSPLIEQNGHDIDYTYLSGGEKTAAALAYRLALNQVINNLVDTINTRDLIILDEPTDGFSSEQLDRIRNVLEELNIKQTIIVSHEDKVESFVDNVIRFEKREHVSYVK